MDGSRILVFMETKRGCDQVTRQLRLDGWPALSIHGDKSQSERDWVLAEFKTGKSPIMTATDVAARGLGRCCGLSWQCVVSTVSEVFSSYCWLITQEARLRHPGRVRGALLGLFRLFVAEKCSISLLLVKSEERESDRSEFCLIESRG